MSRRKGSPRRIAAWAKRCPATADTLFQLVVVGLGGESVTHVAQWPGAAAETPDGLGEDVLEVAQYDCDGRGSQTNYEVRHVTNAGAPSEMVLTHNLRLYPVEEDAVEAASLSGLLQQMMRHSEAKERLLVQSVANVHQAYGHIIKTLTDRLTAAERSAIDAASMEVELVKATSLAEDLATDAARQARAGGKVAQIASGIMAEAGGAFVEGAADKVVEAVFRAKSTPKTPDGEK